MQTGERIDEVVATFFEKPHSYTTEDIVEISAHGSPVVLEYIVEQALARGARVAEPGEFTMRGFLHGRIDLTQAEAVRDLIESQTLFQAKVAARARSQPCSIFTTIISMAMMASSTSRPSAMMSAPSVMR